MRANGPDMDPPGQDAVGGDLYRAAFDDAAVPMLLTHPDGRVARANRAACQLLGYPRAELEALRATDLLPSWERDCAGPPAPGAEVERQVVRKDGALVWVAVTPSPVRDAAGEPRFLLAQLQDATARRDAEERLRRSEDLYRVVVDNSRDLISLIDLDGRLLFVSSAFARSLGYVPQALVGTYARDLVHPDDVAAAKGSFETSGALPTLRVRRADGSYLPVETNAGRVYDDDGAPLAVVSVSRDVSDRLRSEELEQRLRQVDKLQAVGQLAGGVAHDFNNLLTVIRGYQELALVHLDSDTERIRDDLAEIRRAADGAAELTRQLLAFGRQQVLQPTVVDLNAIVADYRQMLDRLLGDDVEIRLALDPQLGRVRADVGQIGQVIVNLAVNARDAMPDGGTVTISTANAQLGAADVDVDGTPGAYAQLVVADAGAGIDDATMPHLFEPFFTTKEKGSGTGLGLSTVFGIVKQSGGQIRVASTLGRGTRVVVSLPVVDGELPSADGRGELRLPLGAGRVLVVEDQEVVRSLTCEILREYGYEVESAAHPQEALALAGRGGPPFDLLVTDVVMPELNGRELADRLRQTWSELRVLFISGYTDDAMIARGVLGPGCRFLQKPFTSQQLGQAAYDVLAE